MGGSQAGDRTSIFRGQDFYGLGNEPARVLFNPNTAGESALGPASTVLMENLAREAKMKVGVAVFSIGVCSECRAVEEARGVKRIGVELLLTPLFGSPRRPRPLAADHAEHANRRHGCLF